MTKVIFSYSTIKMKAPVSHYEVYCEDMNNYNDNISYRAVKREIPVSRYQLYEEYMNRHEPTMFAQYKNTKLSRLRKPFISSVHGKIETQLSLSID